MPAMLHGTRWVRSPLEGGEPARSGWRCCGWNIDAVRGRATSSSIPGDINSDGEANLADLLILPALLG